LPKQAFDDQPTESHDILHEAFSNLRRWNMKPMNTVYVFMAAALLAAPISYANKDFYGTIESRPEGNTGKWVVGGRNVDVTDKTRLVEEYGPLSVGACVEVGFEGKSVKEIASEKKRKCKRRGRR
jgi:hypothetical protein